MQRLRSAEHRGERLQRDAHHVVLRLLRGESRAGGLRMESQLPTGRFFRLEPFRMMPAHSRRAARNLATSSSRLLCALKKKEMTGKVVDLQASLERRLDVGDAVGEREGHFLHGGRAGFADVVAADRDGIPVRHFAAQNWKISVISRIDGAGGKM